MKFVFRVIVVVLLAFFAYDYYQVRTQAICAHNAIASSPTHQ